VLTTAARSADVAGDLGQVLGIVGDGVPRHVEDRELTVDLVQPGPSPRRGFELLQQPSVLLPEPAERGEDLDARATSVVVIG